MLEGGEEYEVEAILNHRRKQNGYEYLLKWRGYGAEENSWEKEIDMNCDNLLAEYKVLHDLNFLSAIV